MPQGTGAEDEDEDYDGLPHPYAGDLRITRVFSCVARGFRARASFMFAGCYWWRSLAVDGSSGASRGHARNASARCSVERRCCCGRLLADTAGLRAVHYLGGALLVVAAPAGLTLR